ncbi:MAG: hypothetical protein ABSD02_11920 [Steroidobacteraceae bacterium]
MQIEVRVGVDRQRKYEVLGLLIVRAEPGDPGDLRDAGYASDLLLEGKRQQQRERESIGRENLLVVMSLSAPVTPVPGFSNA